MVKKMSFFLFLTVLLLLPAVSFSSTTGKIEDKVKAKIGSISIPFIENTGQVGNDEVSFYAKTFGGTVFVTKHGEIVYSLPKTSSESGVQGSAFNKILGENSKGILPDIKHKDIESKEIIQGIALKEKLLGADIKGIRGEEKTLTKVSCFKGNDPSRWKSNIQTYNLVSLGEVYAGIELKLKAHGNNIEKLFTLKAGGNPEDIKLGFAGSKGIKVNNRGELEIETELGTVKFTKPVAYQEIKGKKVEVAVSYEIAKSEISNQQYAYGFKVGDYDETRELVIDPLLASTYIGGSEWNTAHTLSLDSSGNVFVAGSTYSSNYPTTPGAYDTSFNGGSSDAFISKFSSDLTTLLASTFIGGNVGDFAHTLSLDSSGNMFVAGYTNSSNYPTTPGAYDTSFNGFWDAFISKLNNDLTTLLASTFIGGSNDDLLNWALTIDLSGNVFVAGSTYSSNYPTTPGAYDTSFNGGLDGFISKLTPDLAANPLDPVIDSISFDECISELSTSAISVTADDPQGGPLTYTYEPLDGGTIIGSGPNVQFDPPAMSPGDPCLHRVKVTITSSTSGLSASETICLYVTLPGDCDCSCSVSIAEVQKAINHFLSLPGTYCSDLNGNGICSIDEVQKVINCYLGLPSCTG